MSTENYVCIACPIGCPLELVHEGDQIVDVSGNKCVRGAKYARQEFTDPRRTFSTTVPIEGSNWARLPVKLAAPVPKDRILEAAQAVHQLRVQAPIRMGEVLARDLLGLDGVNVVATRSLGRA
ncbi:MAG: DUF1667 domain-containing protein [Deltaproteobacteria bacterium]|nr:DUF1667 domain-containing protein [Deltaproteobacteria bacterium]